MYMHAVYKIREFLSYKGFNLIKVHLSANYSALCTPSIVSILVAPAVRF